MHIFNYIRIDMHSYICLTTYIYEYIYIYIRIYIHKSNYVYISYLYISNYIRIYRAPCPYKVKRLCETRTSRGVMEGSIGVTKEGSIGVAKESSVAYIVGSMSQMRIARSSDTVHISDPVSSGDIRAGVRGVSGVRGN